MLIAAQSSGQLGFHWALKSKAFWESQFPPAELRFFQGVLLTFSEDLVMEMKRKKNWVKISIRDSATGVEGKDFPRLFVPFKRPEKFMSRRYQGNGLGLSLEGSS